MSLLMFWSRLPGPLKRTICLLAPPWPRPLQAPRRGRVLTATFQLMLLLISALQKVTRASHHALAFPECPDPGRGRFVILDCYMLYFFVMLQHNSRTTESPMVKHPIP